MPRLVKAELYSEKLERIDNTKVKEMDNIYARAESLRNLRIHNALEYGNPDRLQLLVEEINVRHLIMRREVFTIGELLYEARDILKGKFQKWIQENFDFSYDTANNIIHVYQCCGAHKDLVKNLNPTFLYRLSAPSFPEELRESLFAQGNLENMKLEHLKALLTEYKEKGFEAIKDKLDKIFKTYRIDQMVRYSLDNLELVIRDLENHRDKILKHTGGAGQVSIGDELNREIVVTIDQAINSLNAVKDDCDKTIQIHSENELDKTVPGIKKPKELVVPKKIKKPKK